MPLNVTLEPCVPSALVHAFPKFLCSTVSRRPRFGESFTSRRRALPVGHRSFHLSFQCVHTI